MVPGSQLQEFPGQARVPPPHPPPTKIVHGRPGKLQRKIDFKTTGMKTNINFDVSISQERGMSGQGETTRRCHGAHYGLGYLGGQTAFSL